MFRNFKDLENASEAASVDQTPKSSHSKKLRGQRKPKKIQIETYANVVLNSEESSEDKGVLPKSSREQTPMTDEVFTIPEVPGEINFFSGNPFVERTTGILHLYKNK
jgi:BRCA1-associated protein